MQHSHGSQYTGDAGKEEGGQRTEEGGRRKEHRRLESSFLCPLSSLLLEASPRCAAEGHATHLR